MIIAILQHGGEKKFSRTKADTDSEDVRFTLKRIFSNEQLGYLFMVCFPRMLCQYNRGL